MMVYFQWFLALIALSIYIFISIRRGNKVRTAKGAWLELQRIDENTDTPQYIRIHREIKESDFDSWNYMYYHYFEPDGKIKEGRCGLSKIFDYKEVSQKNQELNTRLENAFSKQIAQQKQEDIDSKKKMHKESLHAFLGRQ